MTTAVIGGGLGGALTARALELAGDDVVVMEASAMSGGVTSPVRIDGYLLEPAAGSLLLPHPHLSSLLDGLDVTVSAATPAARNRFVHHHGATVAVKPGPALLSTPLVSSRAKLRLLAEPFVRSRAADGESLESFLARRVGPESGRLMAALMAGGVHGADPSRLSATAAFPRLAALESAHGSLFRGVWANRKNRPPVRPSTHIVKEGTAAIAEAVASTLGDCWKRSWPVQRIEPIGDRWRIHGPDPLDVDRVVAAIPPEDLELVFPPAAALTGSEWADVAVVWLGLSGPNLPDGIGALIGPDDDFVTMGFLYESAYAPFRAPTGRGLVKAIVGGGRNPDAAHLPDDELVEKVTLELSRVLGESVDVSMSHVVRRRIPQYTTHRQQMISRLDSVLPPGLEVAGWAYHGVGLTDLATGANRLAQRIQS